MKAIAFAVLVAAVACVACNNDKAEAAHEQALAASAAAAAASAEHQKDMAEANKEAQQAASAAAVQAAAHALAEAKEDEQKAAAEARADVLANPGKYLKASDPRTYDKGIINSYRQLVGLTVLNTSKFPLTNVTGTVTWMSGGATLGTTPFQITGSIAPGQSESFTQAAGTLSAPTTIQGAATPQIAFTHATIATR